MPRDASGTFAFTPSSVAPAVPDTVIDASDFNAAMEDIAAELTDSLSRSGKGGMDTPMLFEDGTEAAPGIAYADDTGTGFFRPAAGEIGVSSAGTEVARFTADGQQITGDLDVSGGLTLGTPLDKGALPAVGQQVSGASGNFSSTAAGATDITNATVTITTTGRPVALVLQCAGDTYTARIYVGVNGGATPTVVQGTFRMVRSGTAAGTYEWILGASGSASVSLGIEVPPGVIQYIDFPAAGTYTYKLQVLCAANTIVAVEDCKLVAFEL